MNSQNATLSTSTCYNHTDVGNAQRFIDQYGDIVRYQWSTKTWFIWDGRSWKSDNTGYIYTLAQKTIECQDSSYDKWKAYCGSMRALNSIIELAKISPRIAVSPNHFDAQPWLVNCQNCTLNLYGGNLEVLDHNPDHNLTITLPVEYDPESEALDWKEFLEFIF